MNKMNNIDEIIHPLLQSERDLFWQGPASESTIKQVESSLDSVLPSSFRLFLLKYGGGGVVGEEISGIESNDPNLEFRGTVLGDTKRCRTEHGLPPCLTVIYLSDDGPCWCLDGSRLDEAGECPVVSYSVYKHKIDAEIAPSFSAFLKQYVELRAR